MGISKVWGKAVVVAGCLGVMASAAHAGYDENVGAATDSSSSNMSGSMSGMSRSEMRMRNAQMLIQTLSEEKTEIAALTAQRQAFLRMGTGEDLRIARLWARWISEHKAGSPTFIRLIRLNGGDPMEAHVLKAPPLGTREQMLMATHRDHVAAVMTSQTRFFATMSPSVKNAMHKRANLARKHLAQMTPFHRYMNGMDSGMSTTSGGGMDMSNDSSTDSTDSSTTTTTTTTTTDTTTTDSATTGTTDSGTTDSTTTDSTATTTDSGTMDSGTTDSTTTDSATTDSGTTDSGTSGMDTKGADAAGTSTTDSTMSQ